MAPSSNDKMRNSVASLLALAATASATIKGFNYGSTFTTGVAKQQADFEAEFTTAQGLVGADGFTSARLYTMVVRVDISCLHHISVTIDESWLTMN